jgi:cytidylate kinase
LKQKNGIVIIYREFPFKLSGNIERRKDMSDNLIITIGRECGAGGRSVAAVLSEKYGIKVYDEELLDLAVKESGLARELFEMHDERPNRSFLYNLVMDT